MLLIIFLALIANSALLSGACDVGRPRLNNFVLETGWVFVY